MTAALRGIVVDGDGGKPLPAWVCVRGADGAVIGDWQVDESLPGFGCDGAFAVDVPAGRVTVAVHRLASHEWAVDEFDAAAGGQYERRYELRSWADLRRRGYFCGESHNHLNHPTDPRRVALYCRALGIDYLNVCQGWLHRNDPAAGVSGERIDAFLRSHSTADFHMHFGAERPKTRYGHVWWWNLRPFDDPYGEYLGWHDTEYFAFAGCSADPVDRLRERFPFRNELPFKTWKRYRDQGAACALAHPTSWWTNAPGASLVATNISVEMPFALLAGGLVDAVVVMGYDADHVFYQSTWFHILNEGYSLPAVAETDGAMRGGHHIGQILGYVPTPDGAYSQGAIVEGVRRGRCTMSSGPLLLLTADEGSVQTGDAIGADGRRHTLEVEAWCDPNPDEFLSFLVVYRNGEIHRKIDLRDTRPRHYRTTLDVAEAGGRAWYVAKVYGSTYPREDVFFDPVRYAELCERERHTEYADEIRQVGLTNPVFFEPPGWQPPRPVVCETRLRVVGPRDKPITGAVVRVLKYDEQIARLVTDVSGEARGRLAPTCELDISAEGFEPVRKSIFLDYDPVNLLHEYTMSGRWRAETASGLSPGQVPWWAFRFDEIRSALENVDWTIRLEPLAGAGPRLGACLPGPGL